MVSKAILIFSDGTGQAGGFRFDEKRSNIYKLYRATRCGPDSSIDPREQVAFYDPGLGSQADGQHLAVRFLRWIHNTVAQATGFGITRNIIDCYAALIQLWEPGDRIFLFGFSRGAYTVRCLAGVIARCGIPTQPRNDPCGRLKLDRYSAQRLAAYAVKHVYQFTYPRPKNETTPRQLFLLETRDRLADRFRREYGSADCNDPSKANVYPYFIGVFDTVAALGNPVTTAMITATFLLFAIGLGLVGQVLSHVHTDSALDWLLRLLSFQHVFSTVIAIAASIALAVYVFTHLKFDFTVPGYDLGKSVRIVHLNELWMQFYDYELNANVSYARHAISTDENRKSFQRVKWHSTREAARDESGLQWFEQVWFAGNHSDIGGSYPENEARLSDITLDWMVKWASAVPHGIKFDGGVLKLSPYPDGPQHDEVKSGLGLLTKLLGWSWPKEDRALPVHNAIMHRSVYERFDLKAVQVYDQRIPYRPNTLARHVDFARYYGGSPFPADSLGCQTAMSEEPPQKRT